jgi:hypothetical protein
MAVTNRNEVRNAYARLIAARCSYDAEFAERFHVVDAEGRRLAVPVLEDDPLVLACRLVRQIGGEAVLAVLHKPDKPARKSKKISLPTTIASMGVTTSDSDGRDNCVPVGPECTVGDVLRILTPGVSISMRFDGEELQFDDPTSNQIEADRDLIAL